MLFVILRHVLLGWYISFYGTATYGRTIESASNEDQLLINEHSENELEVDDKLIIRCSCTLEKDNPKMHDRHIPSLARFFLSYSKHLA